MKPSRKPHLSRAANIARHVFKATQLRSPTEVPIELLAHMQGALVTEVDGLGARANVFRMGSRAVISIRGGLSRESFRFAVAHELGHLELHPAKNYLNLCTDIAVESSDYLSSGHEPEANAFAAELLMPESLVSRFADVKQVTWEPVRAIAAEFQVPLTSAALRFVASCPERVALVSSVRGKVEWTARGPDFGHWIVKRPLDPFTLAFDFWETGKVSGVPETVSANAWIESLDDDAELVEHALALPGYDRVLSLLWIKSDAEF